MGRRRIATFLIALVVAVLFGGCADGDRRVAMIEEIPGAVVEVRRIALPGHLYWPVYYIMEASDTGERFRSETVYFIDRDIVDTMRFSTKTGLREGEWEVIWDNRPRGSRVEAEFHPFLLIYPERFWSYPRVREDRAGVGQGFRDGPSGSMADWD